VLDYATLVPTLLLDAATLLLEGTILVPDYTTLVSDGSTLVLGGATLVHDRASLVHGRPILVPDHTFGALECNCGTQHSKFCVDDTTLVPDDAILMPREILMSNDIILGYGSSTWQLSCSTCNFGACRHNFDGAILMPDRVT
jgi:hypothetical protein